MNHGNCGQDENYRVDPRDVLKRQDKRESWELIKEKDIIMRYGNMTRFTGWCLDRVTGEGESLTVRDHPEAPVLWVATR